jgi:hypothetical protein
MTSFLFRKTNKRKGVKLDSTQHTKEKIPKTSKSVTDNINVDTDTREKTVTENSSTETEMDIVDQEVRQSSLFNLVN